MQGREDHPRSVDMLGGEEDFGGGPRPNPLPFESEGDLRSLNLSWIHTVTIA